MVIELGTQNVFFIRFLVTNSALSILYVYIYITMFYFKIVYILRVIKT